MQNKLISFAIPCCISLVTFSALLGGCQTSPYVDDPLCARVVRKLDQGAVVNATPSYRVVTSADRARLLREYNQLGCHEGSDKRFAYPFDSLTINKEVNESRANGQNQ